MFEELRLLMNFQTDDRFLVTHPPHRLAGARRQGPPTQAPRPAHRHPLPPQRRSTPPTPPATSPTGCRWPAAPRQLFTPEAVQLIFDFTRGTPREINNLCDVALLVGYSPSAPRRSARRSSPRSSRTWSECPDGAHERPGARAWSATSRRGRPGARARAAADAGARRGRRPRRRTARPRAEPPARALTPPPIAPAAARRRVGEPDALPFGPGRGLRPMLGGALRDLLLEVRELMRTGDAFPWAAPGSASSSAR